MAKTAPRFIVGIDLGTTHTVVAYVDTEGLQKGQDALIRSFPVEQLVAPGEIGKLEMLPSARYHPALGELAEEDTRLPWSGPVGPDQMRSVIGKLALDRGARVPGRLVTSAKSWLSHGAVDRTAPILPWGAPPEIEKISPVDASASYLDHVAKAWEHAFPGFPLHEQEVVLTVPASFDEAARALTLRASRAVGLEKLRLVEEPQAAFYSWLYRHQDDLEGELEGVHLALVVDVGGGTTDLTLIRVEMRESGPRITRIAVGDHLMLGGDNMDLALAKRAEQRIGEGGQLGSARFSQLIQQCRSAKELLLSDDAPERTVVTVLGSGAKLVGGARSTEIAKGEVHELVLEGFFPRVARTEQPQKRRGAIVEFGLPYVADPAITKHVASFLTFNAALTREVLNIDDKSVVPIPDAIMFNGGVFRGDVLLRRTLDVLGDWRGQPLRLLANEAPELAVARGAAAYGLARRGLGVKIGGGSPRSYFLLIDGTEAEREAHKAVCLLPRGAEEGEELAPERTFSLRVGRPVRFHVVASSSDVRYHRPGDVVTIEGGGYQELPPIAAVLEMEGVDLKANPPPEVPVRVIAALTELGTLEMSCVKADDPRKRWKLEFQLRGDSQEAQQTKRVTQLHPRFGEATERVKSVFGKSQAVVETKAVKTLRQDLERTLGERSKWDTALLRELFGALLAGAKHRRRSADHERVWFNLAGFCMRPGFGYPLDDWRAKQIAPLYEQGVQFAPEAQNWSEWWIFWRRVAGGLDASLHHKIFASLEYYLEPPSDRPRPRPAGPRAQGYDDMVRLVGSLEHLNADKRVQAGQWLVARLGNAKAAESPQSWWAVGRLGARVPFYGSAHNVVPRDVVMQWLARVIALDWKKVEQAAFAATLMARASGDRERDLPDTLRAQVVERLVTSGSPENWVRMVREVTHLDAADERRVFGESLPPGLRLVD